jgi:hypothetical protein
MSWVVTSRTVNPPLLDAYSGAAAAYSLRQLQSGSYPVVRVRRSSDNTESDFTATQVSDGSLAAWVGAGNNGFVRTWYDQSGNGRHATQTTTANQPQIISSGALLQTNSKPALDFNGTSQRFNIPTIAFNMNALSVNIVSKADASTSQMAFASPDSNRVYAPFLNSGVYYVGYATTGTAFNFGSSSLASQYLVQLNAGSSTANAWRNGIASTAVSSGSAAESGINLSIGSYRNDQQLGGTLNSFWDGTIQEIVFYISDRTSIQSAIASNINSYYAIY